MGIKKKHVPGCGCCGGVTSCGCTTNPTSWNVTLTGIGNSNCTDCGSWNSTFSCTLTSPCRWIYNSILCDSVNATYIDVQLTTAGGNITYTVRLVIGFGDEHRWIKTIAGSNCSLSAENIPWSDQVTIYCTSGASSTCTLTAVP